MPVGCQRAKRQLTNAVQTHRALRILKRRRSTNSRHRSIKPKSFLQAFTAPATTLRINLGEEVLAELRFCKDPAGDALALEELVDCFHPEVE